MGREGDGEGGRAMVMCSTVLGAVPLPVLGLQS